MAPVDSEAVTLLVGYFTTLFRLIEPNREALPVTFMQVEMRTLMEGKTVRSLGMICSFTWDAAEKLAFISRELVQASRMDR